MVSQRKLMSGWGLWKRRSALPCKPTWLVKDFTLLFYVVTTTATTVLRCSGLCPGLPKWTVTRKVKSERSTYQSGFTGARDSEWQWHQLGHMQICTSPQTHNHASILMCGAATAKAWLPTVDSLTGSTTRRLVLVELNGCHPGKSSPWIGGPR